MAHFNEDEGMLDLLTCIATGNIGKTALSLVNERQTAYRQNNLKAETRHSFNCTWM